MTLSGTGATVAPPDARSLGSTSAPAMVPSVELLVERMRAGDRAAAAEFVSVFGPLIRRRVRGKLGPSMRRLFDSAEILSTFGRRLDRYVSAGRLQASTGPQLWALVFKMVDAAVVDKARVMRRLRMTEGEDSEFAQTLLGRLEDAAAQRPDGAENLVDSALRLLTSGTDRQILSLWLMGHPHGLIADLLALSPDNVRQRWRRIREHLREQLNEDEN